MRITTPGIVCFISLAFAVVAFTAGCDLKGADPDSIQPHVIIEPAGLIQLHEDTARVISSSRSGGANAAGLFGAQGGARLKVLKAGVHEVLIPMPQLADNQIPVSYAITTTPREAGTEYRLHTREDSNVVVSLQLKAGRDQEIQINWSSIILIANKPAVPKLSRPEPYLRETSCVQSGAGPITKLATELWPENGRVDAFAGNIEEFIRKMKQEKPPRSMDASGILESGGNWICTANANLAAALMRAKKIPARSIAVIPPTGQRLEMHRIVEYFEGNQWIKFDPSSLQKDIPMKPWQNIIMAKTTTADEDLAMKPRMGTSLGCPYGQELELLDSGMTLWGQDFFWTTGKSIAGFEPGDEAVVLAASEWNRFLESGKLSQGQLKAASATNAVGFLDALKVK